MTGIFTTQQAFALSTSMAPLLIGTIYSCYRMHSTFAKLGHYVNLSQAAEAQRDGTAPDVERLKRGHPVTVGQTNLNRQRYKHRDANLFVVAEDPKVRIPFAIGFSLIQVATDRLLPTAYA